MKPESTIHFAIVA